MSAEERAEPPNGRDGSAVPALIVAGVVFFVAWLAAIGFIALGYGMAGVPASPAMPLLAAFIAAVPATLAGALIRSIGRRIKADPRRNDGVPITLDQLRALNAARKADRA